MSEITTSNSYLTEKAQDYTILSELAYADWTWNGAEWVPIDPKYADEWAEIVQKGYKVSAFHSNDESGFSATLFTKDGKDILAIRGTTKTDPLDLAADAELASKELPAAQYQAMVHYIFDIISQGHTQFDITGHSLGGALAQAAKATFSCGNVYTYNAPGANVVVGPMLDPSAWEQSTWAAYQSFLANKDIVDTNIYNISGNLGVSPISGLGNDIGREIFVANFDHGIAPLIKDLSKNDYYIDPRKPVSFIGSNADERVDGTYDSGHYSDTVQNLSIEGGYGNDTIIGSSGHDVFYGDLDDTLQGNQTALSQTGNGTGEPGDDLLDGGGGNDCLYGGGGNDSLLGGAGDDLLDGGSGEDILVGEAGNDMLKGGADDDTYKISYGDGQDTIIDTQGTNWIVYAGQDGTQHLLDNFYSTGEGANVWVSADGTIQTGHNSPWTITFEDGGTVTLGEGTDISGFGITLHDALTTPDTTNTIVGDLTPVYASDGTVTQGANGNIICDPNNPMENRNDLLWDSDVNDRIDGKGGNDIIYQGIGDDWVTGGEGRDGIGMKAGHEPNGNDILEGSAGADLIYGGTGDDQLFGDNKGEMADIVTAGETAPGIDEQGDLLDGGAGNDFVYGSTQNDALFGGAGQDLLSGGAGNDVILADWNSAGTGADSWAEDYDALHDTWTQGAAFDWSSTIDQEGAVYFEPVFENISAGVAEETGSDGDVVYAGTGNDFVLGGFGDDEIYAGEGNDTVSGDNGDDFISGGGGDDILLGDNNYYPSAEHGNDFIDGGGGNDYIDGAAKDDTLYGGAGNDTIYGDDGEDDAGGDYIDGGTEDDCLYGGAGNDTIYGGEGNDSIHGNQGNDTLAGGAGSDTYFFNVGDGHDVIDDISGDAGANKVVFGEGLSFAAADIRWEGDRLILNFGKGDVLELNNFDAYDPTSSGAVGDFILSNGYGMSCQQVLNEIGFQQTGSSGDDYLEGTSFKDVLAGQDGNDYLESGEGNDDLSGDAGADTMVGGTGNDTYAIDDPGDVIAENTDEGIDTVNSSIGYTLGDNAENLTLTGTNAVNGAGNDLANAIYGNSGDNILTGNAGDDYLDSGAGNDLIYGGDGNDVLVGNTGADTMIGGIGNDTYYMDDPGDIAVEDYVDEMPDLVIASINYNLGDYVENLTLSGNEAINGTGNDFNNVITGNGADNSLFGNAGNDTLVGGEGDDTLIGGTDNDSYFVDDPADVVIENADEGIDMVNSSISYNLGDNLENLTLTGADAINGTGNDFNNVIIGNTADNALLGKVGVDSLYGGAGNDTLDGSEGNDRLIGEAGTDTIFGGDGDDVLDGDYDSYYVYCASSADNMAGGLGDDTYWVNNIGDIVTENLNEGKDKIYSQVSYTLPENVENLALTKFENINGIGNSLGNIIEGNEGKNVLYGLEGDDRLADGLGGIDTMIGGIGNDWYWVDNTYDVLVENFNEGVDSVYAYESFTLPGNFENLTLGERTTGVGTWKSAKNGTGNSLDNIIMGNWSNNVLSGLAGNDTLSGSSGNDTLDGGTGEDIMAGDIGNDTYVVDNVGDLVTEKLNFGTDLVQSSITFTLSDNVENLTLTGTVAINGTGNALDNIIIGNANNNALSGLAGNDTLKGNSGNDTLDGWVGVDTMIGNAGNDTYVVDDIGDIATENLNEGTDLIQSSVTYMLPDNIENLTLTGTAAINGTGNTLNNVITGNSGNNVLTGGAGADTMLGDVGNDTYIVDNAGDVITENPGEGTDSVQSNITYTLSNNIENLSLIGSESINGTGNTHGNVIIGNNGINTLVGETGNDALLGGAGNDVYVFNLGDGVDTITDVSTVGEGNVIRFGEGITKDDLTFVRNNGSLTITVGTTERVR